MGCDIHFYVENKVNGDWQSADRWEPSEASGHEVEPASSIHYKKRFYSDRNYSLFAILADVRNGRGFAGCDTGNGFVPIDDPRGLPDDVSDMVKAASDCWDGDGHSHSWFTVAELLEYDWTQTTKHRGYVSAAQFYEWNRWRREDGEGPESYCGDVGGGSVEKVSEAEMRRRIEEVTAGDWYRSEEKVQEQLPSVYCQVEWEQPYYKAARGFLSDTLPQLWRLGKPEDVRIVFWFDN
ncbi:hypothetical protein [Paludisphaera mucosa]|uniref:Uncharacterized protein n=1 Tax=Paludisphaera mucosa TaxID=3030827 RepID=A0ABT6FG17_9BACT|nr:hypothetical protein [Paludisphaera mucosa]MDG3006431.1 hypothetical protein [Paludisphaera mucosa]